MSIFDRQGIYLEKTRKLDIDVVRQSLVKGIQDRLGKVIVSPAGEVIWECLFGIYHRVRGRFIVERNAHGSVSVIYHLELVLQYSVLIITTLVATLLAFRGLWKFAVLLFIPSFVHFVLNIVIIESRINKFIQKQIDAIGAPQTESL